MATTINTAMVDLDHLTHDDRYLLYNGADCCVTMACWEALRPKAAEAEPTYSMSRAMQGPAWTLMHRGVRVDLDVRDEVLAQLGAENDRNEARLRRIASEGLDRPALNYRSHHQLKELFYGALGLPEVKVFDKGTKEYKPSVNREALERLAAHPEAKHLCELVTSLRDNDKQMQVLQTGLEGSRMHCGYQVAGTMTGRWSSNKSAFGGGCVPGETEVLTPSGWVRIDEFVDGAQALQWDPSGVVSFQEAHLHTAPAPEHMLVVETEQVKQCLTLGHRVPYWSPTHGHFYVRSAAEVSDRAACNLPTSGYKAPGVDLWPRLIVALMADGSREGTGWRISFTKNRKIKRFLQLCQEAGVHYTEQSAKEGYRRFYIPNYKCPRNWGPWVLDCANLGELIKEARYWDGTDRGTSFWFFSAKKDVAAWFSIAAHISGFGTTTRLQEQNFGSYSTTPIYVVNCKPRRHVQVKRKHWRLIKFDEKNVYCLTTKTGFFFIRYRGFTSVTGNTNLQNIPDAMRRIFVPDPGMKLCQLDLQQAESKLVAYLCLPFGSGYLNACNSGDLHTYVTRLIWPDLFRGANAPDKEVAKRPFYRDFSYRDMAKRGGHGTNYGGTAPTLANHLKIPRAQAEAFQGAYLARFPEITRWHTSVKVALARGEPIVTPFGRRCHFPGRHWDNDTIKSAIAYVPQSTIGDVLNRGFYNVWRRFDRAWDATRPIEILLQVHDAIVFQYPAEIEPDILPAVMQELVFPIEINGQTCLIDVDAQVGWNWGKRKETYNDNGDLIRVDNPWGLADWSAKRPDERSPPPPSSELDRLVRTLNRTYK